MFNRSESFFQGAHKTKLFYQVWEPARVEGHLIVTHGQAEHSNCYQRLVEGLQDLNYAVYAWDLRGHGRSEGRRGYARSFDEYVKDLELFVQHLRQDRYVHLERTVLLGHSMGGLIQLKALTENPQWQFRAQVLSSPMLGVAVEVPLYKDLAALAFSNLWPTLTLSNEIQYSDLTRDPKVIEEFNSDNLRHDRISSGVYLGAIMAMQFLRETMQKIKLPTLMQIPEKDPVVGSENSQVLFEKLGSSHKVLKIYPDRKHEIYNDLGREEVFSDVIHFLRTL